MKKIFKISSLIAAVLLILIIASYFTITSSFFLKSYIIPYLSKSMGADISVSQIYISPLKSSITINGLKIKDKNQLDIKVEKFECLFNIFDLMNDKITISRLELENSYISINTKIRTQEIPVSNLPKSDSEGQKKSTGKIELPILNISNINVTNFNFIYKVTKTDPNTINITKINNLNISIPYFKTSGKGLIQFLGDISSSHNSNKLAGKIQGKLTTELNDKTFPNMLNLNSQLNLGSNITLLEIIFKSHKINNTIPFNMRGYLKNLPLEPFLQNFVQGAYKNSNGKINDITFTANAPDIQSSNLLKNISGNLNINASNVYIPVELLNNPIGKLILLPINIIADSGKHIKSSDKEEAQALNLLSSSASSAKKIKSLEFDSGIVDISVNNGNIDIKEFHFIGSSYSAVDRLNITGSINKKDGLNLNTKTEITGIYLPIQIQGTINNPSPNYKMLIPALLNSNINNILKQSKNGAKDIGSALGKVGKNFISSLSNNEKNKDSNDSNDFKKDLNKSANNLINNINNFIK
jgi:hypothetical protein